MQNPHRGFARATECNYGGCRPWFGCRQCGRRVAVLYPRQRGFACRRCNRIAYASQSGDEIDRTWRKQSKLERRLREHRRAPKGMHSSTYGRIVQAIMDCEERRKSLVVPGKLASCDFEEVERVLLDYRSRENFAVLVWQQRSIAKCVHGNELRSARLYAGSAPGAICTNLENPMHFFVKSLVVGLLATLSFGSLAFTYGSTQTYGGLTWSVSTGASGLSSCTQLFLNASGDFVNTQGFALFGAYNCPALGGGYAATGVGYFGTDGSFNMTVTFGNGAQVSCTRLPAGTMSGTCSIYNSTGTYQGPASVSFP
jgi:hypothetical protein